MQNRATVGYSRPGGADDTVSVAGISLATLKGRHPMTTKKTKTKSTKTTKPAKVNPVTGRPSAKVVAIAATPAPVVDQQPAVAEQQTLPVVIDARSADVVLSDDDAAARKQRRKEARARRRAAKQLQQQTAQPTATTATKSSDTRSPLDTLLDVDVLLDALIVAMLRGQFANVEQWRDVTDALANVIINRAHGSRLN